MLFHLQGKSAPAVVGNPGTVEVDKTGRPWFPQNACSTVQQHCTPGKKCEMLRERSETPDFLEVLNMILLSSIVHHFILLQWP